LIDRGLPQVLLCRATASPTFFPGAVPAPSSRGKKPGFGPSSASLRPAVRVVGPAT